MVDRENQVSDERQACRRQQRRLGHVRTLILIQGANGDHWSVVYLTYSLQVREVILGEMISSKFSHTVSVYNDTIPSLFITPYSSSVPH